MPNGDPKKKIVVVGGGAAGVFTGYLFQKNAKDHFDVTVLEAAEEIGGHAHSLKGEGGGETVNIDAGAQFFSTKAQPVYVAMLHDEGFFDRGEVEEFDAGMTLWSQTHDEVLFRIPPKLGQIAASIPLALTDWINLGIFVREAEDKYASGDWTETFGDWLDSLPLIFDKESFKARVARPLMYQFGLVDPDKLADLSARFVVYYFVGLLPDGIEPFKIFNSTIGLDGILEWLVTEHGVTVETQKKVTAVEPKSDGGYQVKTEDGTDYPADEVVFATNPKWTLQAMPSGSQYDAVRAVLDQMGQQYLTVPVLIDTTWTPPDDDVWTVSNVLVVGDVPDKAPTHYMLTVWFGAVRKQAIGAYFTKSWGNPELVPHPLPGATAFDHTLMVGTPSFIASRQTLREQHQGEHDLWYAGGYILDYDSQNAALKSAANVVNAILAKYAVPIDPDEAFLVQPRVAGAAPEAVVPEEHLPEPVFERSGLFAHIEQLLEKDHGDTEEVQEWLKRRK